MKEINVTLKNDEVRALSLVEEIQRAYSEYVNSLRLNPFESSNNCSDVEDEVYYQLNFNWNKPLALHYSSNENLL